MADFYADRRGLIPPLPWPTFSPPFSQVVVSAILVNALNPKLSIFFLAFLPQFVSAAEARPLLRMLELSLIFMTMTLGVFVLYGVFASAMRAHIVSRPAVMAWMRRGCAAAFVALGGRLALAER